MTFMCLGRRLVSVGLALGFGATAFASDFSDRFDLHGYGNQDYLQSRGNPYLGTDHHGSWNSNFLGLVMSATLSEKSKLWAQLESSTNDGTRFTWFFVDYQLSDAARVHVGRVKLPLGFYNEIVDVKALQVTSLLPSLYQTGADMVHDAYNGAGFDYEQDVGSGHLLWQAWGGNTYDTDPPSDTRDRRAFGGRVTWRTPLDGLKLMVSGYRTQVENLADRSMSNETRVILGAEFARENWDLKAEVANHNFMGVKSLAYYAQGGYTFDSKWTPYARYDFVTTDRSRRSDPSYYQRTGVLGVGYKIDSNIGLKIENHFNRGYALPVATGEVTEGTGSRHWNLLVVTVDFLF